MMENACDGPTSTTENNKISGNLASNQEQRKQSNTLEGESDIKDKSSAKKRWQILKQASSFSLSLCFGLLMLNVYSHYIWSFQFLLYDQDDGGALNFYFWWMCATRISKCRV